LPPAFYDRPSLVVARELLGQRLVHALADGSRRGGRIVETEAYDGPTDRASHARSGPKGRASIMWGRPGVAYVYLIYGQHSCFNVVTGPGDRPSAVLVRALELDDATAPARAASGPGLVCRALRIDRSALGLDLTGDVLWLETAPPVADADVLVGPRVGVDYAGEWASREWRFWVRSSPAVSRARPGNARPFGAPKPEPNRVSSEG
jgi:DNA-3-methyladenine glycosylase